VPSTLFNPMLGIPKDCLCAYAGSVGRGRPTNVPTIP